MLRKEVDTVQDNEQRSWLRGVTSQFHHLPMSTAIYAPSWFYLLFFGGFLVTRSPLCWKICGVLLVIAAVPTMVQETRRANGTDLPVLGWWKVFQYLMQDAAAMTLVVFGAAEGFQNLEFAVGLIGMVIVTSWGIFRWVQNSQ